MCISAFQLALRTGVLFAFLIALPSGAKDTKVDALVETALAAKQAGKLDAAIATLETALELKPDHRGALLALGRTFGAKQDYAKARRYLQKLLRVAPDSVDGHRFLALTWLREGNATEALSSALTAKKLAPDKWQTYELLAQIHIASRQIPEAIAAEKKVVSLNPQGIEGHLGLALLYRETKKFKSAEKHLRKAMKLAPKDLGPLMTMAGIKAEQGDVSAAKKFLKKGERMSKGSPRALETIGRALVVMGDAKEALRVYRKALALNGNSLGALVALANLNLLDGDADKAKSLASKVLKLEPRIPDSYKILGLIAASQKDFSTAERMLKKGISTVPDIGKLELRGVLGQLYAGQNKIKEAISELETILQAAPRASGVRGPLCQLYRQGKVKRGRQVCLDACKEVGVAKGDCALP